MAAPLRTFYRIVQTDPATRADFASHLLRKGSPPADLPTRLHRLWDGLSVYDTLDHARRQARRRRYLGRFIAELHVPEDGPVRYEQTTSDPGHYTLWGDPDNIERCVIRILPVREAGERGD